MTQIGRNFLRVFSGLMLGAALLALGLVFWILYRPYDLVWIFSGIGIFLLLLLPLILFSIKSLKNIMTGDSKRHRLLLTNGINAPATILAIQETGVVFNHVRPVVRLTVRVQPPGGWNPFEACLETTISLLQVPKVGDVISVAYDSNSVSDIVIVPS